MRCSSCKPSLDRYLEGTLPPAQMRAIAEHLRHCPRCAALLHEVSVVDALLFTTVASEPATNFTFAVMAEVRTMHAPRRLHHPAPRLVALYIVLAWIAVAALIVFDHLNVGAILAKISTTAAHLSLGRPVFAWFALGIAILVVDAGIAIWLARFHRRRELAS